MFVAVVRYAGPSARLRTTPADLGALVAAAAGGLLLITALALALVFDGSSVVPVNPPNALWAFASTVLIYGGGTLPVSVAATGGNGASVRASPVTGSPTSSPGSAPASSPHSCWWVPGRGRLPAADRQLAVGLRGHRRGNGFDGYLLRLVVVSLLYLPNLAVDGAAALLGTPVHMGAATVDVFDPQSGAVPLPILAILPGPPPIRFLWAAVLVVPLGVAVWAALQMRHHPRCATSAVSRSVLPPPRPPCRCNCHCGRDGGSWGVPVPRDRWSRWSPSAH